MNPHRRLARWMYRGGHPNRMASAMNRVWRAIGAQGWWRNRCVTLEVTGRRSGRAIAFPLIVADLDGEQYLVSMLGEQASWVANVRAADGRAVLVHGDRRPVRLVEVPVAERAPILRRYLDVAPGGRPHIEVERRAPLGEIAAVADRYPVFQLTAA